ncbi:MAG: 50S ribosomal protein L7/L12 [uncultured bacterium]|nr:MAG: 50S ribosomal protein L7/L12 [uncultured bacterium]
MTDEKKDVVVPEKFQALVSQIEGMTVLDLAELVKILEEKFGVSAAAPVMMAAAAAGGEAAAEEKSSFTVELTSSGDQKINVIKALREITALGLKEAKDMADAAPVAVKENVKKEEAEEIKKKLEAAGGTVTLK